MIHLENIGADHEMKIEVLPSGTVNFYWDGSTTPLHTCTGASGDYRVYFGGYAGNSSGGIETTVTYEGDITTPVYSYYNFADLGYDESTERFVGQEFASATSLNTALDGTNNGATTGETGKLGSAWSFDGSNDYVSTTWLPQELQADNPFSVSLWFKTTSTGWGSLINSWGTQNGSGNNGWNLIDTGTSASFRISSNWGASPQDAIRVNTGTNSAFSDGNWHHLVVTYDGTDHTGVT